MGAGYGGAVHRMSRGTRSLELSRRHGRVLAARRPLFASVDEMDEVPAQLAGSVGIEALIGSVTSHAAERLLALLDARARAPTRPPPLADRCRGLLLAAHGRLTKRQSRAFEAAAVVPDRREEANPFELGRTLLALGTVQRRRSTSAPPARPSKRQPRSSSASGRSSGPSTRARSCGESAAELRRTRALRDGAADRRAGRRRPAKPRGRRRAQPEPEHGRVEPLEDLPQARRRLPNRAGGAHHRGAHG